MNERFFWHTFNMWKSAYEVIFGGIEGLAGGELETPALLP